MKRRAIARADLVPVFSFGENDVSHLVKDTAMVQFLILGNRYISRWPMKRGLRFMHFSVNSNQSLVSRCRYSTVEDCSTVSPAFAFKAFIKPIMVDNFR